MNAQLPIRDDARQRENESNLFFRGELPSGWICDQPADDYGVDLRVGVVDNYRVTGIERLVQLKAARSPSDRNYESVLLKVSTYNYLLGLLGVSMLVKYVASEREAYWVLLRDVAPPRSQTQKTLTVRVPRVQLLSATDWHALEMRLCNIQGLKLGAGRREVRDV